jgi:hypothetical protein
MRGSPHMSFWDFAGLMVQHDIEFARCQRKHKDAGSDDPRGSTSFAH